MHSQQPNSSEQIQNEQQEISTREAVNCLNAFFTLVSLPGYFLVALTIVPSVLFYVFTPDWLPQWLRFLSSKTFLIVAIGLVFWFQIVLLLGGSRNAIDFTGIEAVFQMFEDGRSGYLLLAGLIVAVIVLKLTVW